MPKNLIINKPPTSQYRRVAIHNKRPEPTVETHPEYFRVDQEICHKLFIGYKSLSMGPATKPGLFSFEEKEQIRSSMNYHKIIQIFKDVNIKLDINQKLLITRSIKKFCFNQNFINEQEFVKLFKVIVHGLGFKEQIFQELAHRKAAEANNSK